jgi:hypothetical protein
VTRLSLSRSRVEAEVGTRLVLNIDAHGRDINTGEEVTFTDCTKMAMSVSMDKEGVFGRVEGKVLLF